MFYFIGLVVYFGLVYLAVQFLRGCNIASDHKWDDEIEAESIQWAKKKN